MEFPLPPIYPITDKNLAQKTSHFAILQELVRGGAQLVQIRDKSPPDRELVIDVLSVFVLIELFRTFTDYLEYHRVRLRVLSEVGIAFILREIFIGLYDHSMDWSQILSLSVLLAVLVTTRIASVLFPPRQSQQTSEQ